MLYVIDIPMKLGRKEKKKLKRLGLTTKGKYSII